MFVCSILGHPNIFIYFFGHISWIILPYADHSWPIWTMCDQFESGLTCLSVNDQCSNKWPAHIKHIHICGLSPIRIYEDILLVRSWASKYIRLFVWSNLMHLNIFGYSFAQFFSIQIYSEICSNQFYDIFSSVTLCLLWQLVFSQKFSFLFQCGPHIPFPWQSLDRRQSGGRGEEAGGRRQGGGGWQGENRGLYTVALVTSTDTREPGCSRYDFILWQTDGNTDGHCD